MSTTITAADINKLRQATGAGMLDCRKALTESNGDFEASIDWLRKQGQKVAAKRSDREAKEGVIIAEATEDKKSGIILCISAETDFVSRNPDFVAFVQSIANAAIDRNVQTVEELNNKPEPQDHVGGQFNELEKEEDRNEGGDARPRKEKRVGAQHACDCTARAHDGYGGIRVDPAWVDW